MLVAAVALVDKSGLVLLQRRRLTADHGGLWEFPGGKIEAGESPESAAVREIGEELGVALDPAALATITFASGPSTPRGRHPGLVILLYSCRSWLGEPQCREGEEIRWFATGDLGALPTPPLDYPLARALNCALGQNSL